MKIYVPNSAILHNIGSFFSKFDPSQPDQLTIEFHPRWIHVHPVVLSMIACLSHDLRKDQITVIGDLPQSFPYLIRMGLLNYLQIDMDINITEHDPSGRFIPVSQIMNSDDLDRFISDMVPMLHTSPTQAKPIKYIISELLRNSIEHSSSSCGTFICAQYFKTANRISIGVADAGIGILNSLSFCHHPKTHISAIVKATEPGITGATALLGGNDTNGGAGLFFTKRIAHATNNHFVMYSGTGVYKQLPHKIKDLNQVDMFSHLMPVKCIKSNSYPNWQGTITGIDISLEYSQSFQSILNEIKKTFNLDMKQKKKDIHKKRARFA